MDEQTQNEQKAVGNPLDCVNDFWGFWDETWSHWHGPYENEIAARQALQEYADNL